MPGHRPQARDTAVVECVAQAVQVRGGAGAAQPTSDRVFAVGLVAAPDLGEHPVADQSLQRCAIAHLLTGNRYRQPRRAAPPHLCGDVLSDRSLCPSRSGAPAAVAVVLNALCPVAVIQLGDGQIVGDGALGRVDVAGHDQPQRCRAQLRGLGPGDAGDERIAPARVDAGSGGVRLGPRGDLVGL